MYKIDQFPNSTYTKLTSSQKVRTLNRQPADGKRDRPIAFRRKTRQAPRLSDENRARPSGLPTKNATTPTAFQRKLHQAHSLPTTIRNRTSVTRAHEQHFSHEEGAHGRGHRRMSFWHTGTHKEDVVLAHGNPQGGCRFGAREPTRRMSFWRTGDIRWHFGTRECRFGTRDMSFWHTGVSFWHTGTVVLAHGNQNQQVTASHTGRPEDQRGFAHGTVAP